MLIPAIHPHAQAQQLKILMERYSKPTLSSTAKANKGYAKDVLAAMMDLYPQGHALNGDVKEYLCKEQVVRDAKKHLFPGGEYLFFQWCLDM